ncbi:sugar kinase [Marinomonas rhizomae]|uniref:2-dehydro-3-deoxygluconokinase n=1 Tax=Marinomonas rhizomae TaxID=491948 RepID=A0A366IZ71_9GAMM|nr:sugar kinase [Marinomonas rhizomae]RBP80106.1 2-dehydro-3-deoxygluconokinase [Marinomonas rhizomae]RNF72027.1 sugar kinase [Marinomonas rhizomae]
MQNKRTHSFITLGEAMAMFVAKTPGQLANIEEFHRSLAGAEVNVAIGMARLGFEASYISKVGKDSFGQFIRKAISKENIRTAWISESTNHATGFMLKSNVTDGSDPKVEYFRKNSAASTLSATDIDENLFKTGTHLHLTGISIAVSSTMREATKHALNLAKEQGCSVSFDTNLRPTLWPDEATMIANINEFAFASDIVLPGIEEGKILAGSDQPEVIADFYLQHGVKTVIVKLGSKGAFFKTNTGESGTVAGFPVEKVVDTVGAGDSFAVGVISALLDGKAMEQAARRGNLLGSLTVQVRGDSEGLPTRAHLSTLEKAV